MIRVVVTGPPSGTGYFPYKIDWWAEGKPQFVGVSRAPLFDACRQLKQYGLMDDTVVGLYYGEDEGHWRQRTTVGYGARQRLLLSRPEGAGIEVSVEEAVVQPPPETSILEAAAVAVGATVEELIPPPSDAAGLTYVPPATPSEPRPPRRKRPKPLIDTGPAVAEPAMSAKPHRKRRRGASGGRRGSRSRG